MQAKSNTERFTGGMGIGPAIPAHFLRIFLPANFDTLVSLSSLHHGIFFASAATADNCTDNCTFCRQLAQSTAYILCVNNCITAQTATSAFWMDFPFFLTQQAFCIFLPLYHFGTFSAREFFPYTWELALSIPPPNAAHMTANMTRLFLPPLLHSFAQSALHSRG